MVMDVRDRRKTTAIYYVSRTPFVCVVGCIPGSTRDSERCGSEEFIKKEERCCCIHTDREHLNILACRCHLADDYLLDVLAHLSSLLHCLRLSFFIGLTRDSERPGFKVPHDTQCFYSTYDP